MLVSPMLRKAGRCAHTHNAGGALEVMRSMDDYRHQSTSDSQSLQVRTEAPFVLLWVQRGVALSLVEGAAPLKHTACQPLKHTLLSAGDHHHKKVYGREG